MFAQKRLQTDSAVDYADGIKSDSVLAHVAPGLIDLGFVVETGKTAQAKLPLWSTLGTSPGRPG